MINFLAELSRRDPGTFRFTPETAWSRERGIYALYTGPAPLESYWRGWAADAGFEGEPYDHRYTLFLELYIDGWMQPVESLAGLLAGPQGSAGLLYLTAAYAYAHLKCHPWLIEPYRMARLVRSLFLYAPVNPASPSDTALAVNIRETKIAQVRLEKPSISVKLSDPLSGLTKYGAFNITLKNTDGAFDGAALPERGLNTPVYIKRTLKDHPGYADFVTIRAGFVEDVKYDHEKIELSCADRFRALDDPVCKIIDRGDYGIPEEEWKKETGGKELPVLYGWVSAPLLELVETKQEVEEVPAFINGNPGEDKAKSLVVLEGKYLAGEGAERLEEAAITDSRTLDALPGLTSPCPVVYGEEDGKPIPLPAELDPETGVITLRIPQLRYTLTGVGGDGQPIYETAAKLPKPKFARVLGYTDRSITGDPGESAESVKSGNVLVSLINRSASVNYNDGVFDLVETAAYRNASSEVAMMFSGGDVKKALGEALKNDLAFLIQNRLGKLTVRFWGRKYGEYSGGAVKERVIGSWMITQQPAIDFSLASDKYFSTCIVKYAFDYAKKAHGGQYLYTGLQREAVAGMLMEKQTVFETCLAREKDAKALAEKLARRFCFPRATVDLGVGADCSNYNLLDAVQLPMEVNGRVFERSSAWVVMGLDPAQDKLTLEEASFGDGDTAP